MDNIMGDAMTELMTNCIKTHAVALIPIYQIDKIPVVVHIWYSRTDTRFSFHYGVYAPSYNWTFLESKETGGINDTDDDEINKCILIQQKGSFRIVLLKLTKLYMDYYSGKIK